MRSVGRYGLASLRIKYFHLQRHTLTRIQRRDLGQVLGTEAGQVGCGKLAEQAPETGIPDHIPPAFGYGTRGPMSVRLQPTPNFANHSIAYQTTLCMLTSCANLAGNLGGLNALQPMPA